MKKQKNLKNLEQNSLLNPPQEILTEEQLAARVSAMGDSLWLINKLIAEDIHSENIHDDIDRNIRHLEIMLSKESIKNSTYDLTSFETAIANGRAFIAIGI